MKKANTTDYVEVFSTPNAPEPCMFKIGDATYLGSFFQVSLPFLPDRPTLFVLDPVLVGISDERVVLGDIPKKVSYTYDYSEKSSIYDELEKYGYILFDIPDYFVAIEKTGISIIKK